jgi:hypothetical protein
MLNPALSTAGDMVTFFHLGQLMGCCIRSTTCLSLDLAPLLFKLLLFGTASLFDGKADDADCDSASASNGNGGGGGVGDGDSSGSMFARAMHELREIDESTYQFLRFAPYEPLACCDDGSGLSSADREAMFGDLELTYETVLSDGTTRVALYPGGAADRVRFADRHRYARMVVRARVEESHAQLAAMRAGLAAIVPSLLPTSLLVDDSRRVRTASTFLAQSASGSVNSASSDGRGGGAWSSQSTAPHCAPFFPRNLASSTSPHVQVHASSAFSVLSWQDLKLRICGSADVDARVLRARTVYKNAVETDVCVQQWWRLFDSWSPEQRGRYLQFVWARSRLPYDYEHDTTLENHTMNFREYATQELADSKLPSAQTCFCIVDIPKYSTPDIFRQKMELALFCIGMNS